MTDESKTCNCKCNHSVENISSETPSESAGCTCGSCSCNLNITEQEYQNEDILTKEFYEELDKFIKSKNILQYCFVGAGKIETQSIIDKFKPEELPVKLLNKYECSVPFLIDGLFKIILSDPTAMQYLMSLLYTKMHMEEDDDIPENIIPN